MQRLVILLTLVVAALAIYQFIDSGQPISPATPNQTTPPVSDSTRQQARQHIKSLTQQASEDTLDIATADHFVTGNQLLQLPQEQPQTAATTTLSTTEADVATSFAANLPGSTNSNTLSEGPSATPISTHDRLRLQELLSSPEQASDEIFYVHAVQPSDQQGLWGIIHRGLMETFTRGIRIENRDRLLSTHIPEDADEPLNDQRSSWLGHLLKRKVEETWVFNYRQGLLGQDPNVIHPGQQLVIVRFSEDELIDIYNHFTHLQTQ
ncbi:hypothetical protein [Marinobacterium marinum]|uniref:Uncharacterized protein n=1 Tax=Marinobacterium marinum TaxID=2756129 RepID=A0A7W1WX21_9GAMM|nr:hypothetical protein [Marinobacterium marinum]MBA4501712.1 hypothetical protein [Marinobacterium marinum]